MGCPKNIIIQTSVYSPVAGVQTKVAKCSGGEMEVLEIAVQPNLLCHIQFFEGLPAAGSLGNPISLVLEVQANQLWSKPGKVVKDDIYMVVTEAGITLSVEVRSVPLAQ
jgi:hypothetical protein